MMTSLERAVVFQLSLVHAMDQTGEDETHVSAFVHDWGLRGGAGREEAKRDEEESRKGGGKGSRNRSGSASASIQDVSISDEVGGEMTRYVLDTSHKRPCREGRTPSSCDWSSRNASYPHRI